MILLNLDEGSLQFLFSDRQRGLINGHLRRSYVELGEEIGVRIGKRCDPDKARLRIAKKLFEMLGSAIPIKGLIDQFIGHRLMDPGEDHKAYFRKQLSKVYIPEDYLPRYVEAISRAEARCDWGFRGEEPESWQIARFQHWCRGFNSDVLWSLSAEHRAKIDLGLI